LDPIKRYVIYAISKITDQIGDDFDMKEREGRLLTAKQAAQYLGVSVITLRRMEKMGVLSPYRTPGGHRRYSIEMLEEYLENSRECSPR
jgi:excisionase family DNA binding protein